MLLSIYLVAILLLKINENFSVFIDVSNYLELLAFLELFKYVPFYFFGMLDQNMVNEIIFPGFFEIFRVEFGHSKVFDRLVLFLTSFALKEEFVLDFRLFTYLDVVRDPSYPL